MSIAILNRSIRALISVTFAVALCACGGGSDPEPAQALTASDAHVLTALAAQGVVPSQTSEKRHALAAVSGADPAAAAELLFVFAEAQFPQYFPTAQKTRTMAGWYYRYWPQTGAYLAVVDWRVYILGGPFGAEARDMGAVTDYVSVPAATQSITAAKLAACPEASSSPASNFYVCMTGTLIGTQLFDTSKACTFSIGTDGTFTLQSAGTTYSITAAQYGTTFFSKSASLDWVHATVYNKSGSMPYLHFDVQSEDAASSRPFLVYGGYMQVSVSQLFPDASMACRFAVPRS